MIHLTFLVRKLASAISRGCIHHGRRHDFGVTRSASFIEEEIDESALEACTHADIYREAGARNLNAEVKVDKVVFLSELPVRQFCRLDNGISVPVAHCVIRSTLLEIRLHHVVVLS